MWRHGKIQQTDRKSNDIANNFTLLCDVKYPVGRVYFVVQEQFYFKHFHFSISICKLLKVKRDMIIMRPLLIMALATYVSHVSSYTYVPGTKEGEVQGPGK